MVRETNPRPRGGASAVAVPLAWSVNMDAGQPSGAATIVCQQVVLQHPQSLPPRRPEASEQHRKRVTVELVPSFIHDTPNKCINAPLQEQELRTHN